MASAGTITVYLTAEMAEFRARMAEAQAKINGLAQSLTAAGSKMAAIGQQLTYGFTLPLGLAAGASLKFASDFDQSMTRIETLVGISRQQVDGWRKDLLAMAPEVGRTPVQLANALFAVTSAGIHGSQALDILRKSAEASAVGMGDTTQIARTVTAAMQAYQRQGLTAAQATDILTATVREGNLTAEDLAGSLGRVFALAGQLGVSMAQVGGFVATFTRQGVKADEAVTSLRGILSAALKPAHQAEVALKGVGLSSEKLREIIQNKGLAVALVTLVHTFDRMGQGDVLARVFPRIRSLAGVLATAAAQGQSYINITNSIINSNGMLDTAFQRVRSTIAFTFSQFVAKVQAVAIAVGNQLAPSFQSALESLQPLLTHIVTLAQLFGELPSPIRTTAIALLGLMATIGPFIFIAGEMAKAVSGVLSTLEGLAGVEGFGALLGAIGPGAPVVAAIVALSALFVGLKAHEVEAADAAQAAARKMMEAFSQLPIGEQRKQLTARKGELQGRLGTLQNELNLAAQEANAARRGGATQLLRSATDRFAQLQRERGSLQEQLAAVEKELSKLHTTGKPTKHPHAQTNEAAQKVYAKLTSGWMAAESTRGMLDPTLANRLMIDKREATLLQTAINGLSAAGMTGSRQMLELGASLNRTKERIAAETAQVKAAKKALEEHNALIRRGKDLVQSSLNPQERYNASMHALGAALAAGPAKGGITQKQYDETAKSLKTQLLKSTHNIGLLLKKEGFKSGEDLMRGILSGSANMEQILKNALINIAVAYVMNPIKLALGIASPSKVFMGYGQQIGMGLAYGITSTADHVRNASLGLAGAAMNGMGSLSPGAYSVMGTGRTHIDVSKLPKPMTPFEVARDNSWLKVLGLSNSELNSRGGIPAK